MGMVVRTNVPAMNAQRQLGINSNQVSKSLEKLSSGFRINRAADDASGLAISEKMKAQIKGLETASSNSQDGISLVQTAEGGAQEIHDMLNRMTELATKSANGTIQNEVDREAIQREVDDLNTEITRIAKSTNFNGIDLLNGNLAAKASGAVDLSQTGAVDFSDGVTVTTSDGKGAVAESTLQIDKPFSNGDTITLNFNVPDAAGNQVAKSITLTHQDAAITSNDGNLTFSGKTAAEQMASIVDRLRNGTDVASLGGGDSLASVFGTGGATEASVVGGKITFDGGTEGAAGKYHLTSASISNVDSSATNIKTGNTAGTAAGANTAGGVTRLVTGASHYQSGDKLKFEFQLTNGTTASAIVEITDDMLSSGQTSTITENIVNKLKATNFADNISSKGFDESTLKVGDLFNVRSNTSTAGAAEVGSVFIEGKDGTLVNGANDLTMTGVSRALRGTDAYNSVNSGATAVVAGSTAAAGGGAAVGSNAVTVNGNMAVGDQFKLEGTLADGRTFSVMLKAGATADPATNTFAIGATATDTATNIAAALRGGDTKIEVRNADGTTSTLKGSDIFDAAGGTNGGASFEVADAGGVITLANKNLGADNTLGITGSISFAGVTADAAGTTSELVTSGVDATAGTTSFSFNKAELEYGSAITIGTGADAKTFELVQDLNSATTEAGNIRVVIADLKRATSADIANAFKGVIDAELGATTTAGSTWAQDLGMAAGGTAAFNPIDNSLTLANDVVGAGSTSTAIKTESTYGESKNVTIGFNKDAAGKLKLKSGDTLNINGKTYQFDTDVRNVTSGNNFIKVTDFTNQKEIADAIKLAVETDDPTVSATVNNDNTVTLSGKFVNGSFATPKVAETLSGGGLTLQIGDTSDDFNKVTVSVEDLSAKGIGTEGLKVDDQDNANKAIDTIKSAINKVSTNRANLGSLQNRLEHTINNLDTTAENMTSANSRIRDTDMAKEMMNYTKMNVLTQAAQAMLAQANQQPQSILQLLQ